MTDVNTPEWRKALRELCEKATPGPWKQDIDNREGGSDQVLYSPGHAVCFVAIDPDNEEFTHDNAAFIAVAREAVPLLLDALEASERDNANRYRGYDSLKSENAAMRARVEKLEAVREAAEESVAATLEEIIPHVHEIEVLNTDQNGQPSDYTAHCRKVLAALDAALEAARGPA